MSALLPDGITHLLDLPSTLFDAIRDALGYLDFDELPRDERPPRAIWRDTRALRKWFKKVEAKREAEMRGDKSIADEEIDGPVSHNDVYGILGVET